LGDVDWAGADSGEDGAALREGVFTAQLGVSPGDWAVGNQFLILRKPAMSR
jgi:hypothetical protein